MSFQNNDSMRGSGIYSTSTRVGYTCQNIDEETQPQTECQFEGDVDANINDWNNLSLVCPKCGHEADLGDYQEYLS